MLSGCSLHPSPFELNLRAPEHSTLYQCARLYDDAERAVTQAKVEDAQSARIAGYPYLRTNRFLSSYRKEVSGKHFENWLDQLQTLALDGWRVELMNLPLSLKQKLEQKINVNNPAKPTLIKALHACGDIMRKHDLDETGEQAVLKEKAVVPSEYRTWQRIVGFYPLTALAFRFGIENWHDEARDIYNIPLLKLPVQGHLVRYAPADIPSRLSSTDIVGIVEQASNNALSVPVIDPAMEKRLFDEFAPVFEIDTASNDDKIGAPSWNLNNTPYVDTSKPTVYRYLSFTRMSNAILPQLNYLVWFPSRPKTSDFDLLGGHLDGIIWRVTLGTDGKPWMFDSIHACGCYHLFFPTRYTKISEKLSSFDEPPFMPQQPLQLEANKKTVIRIASANHYIERIYFSSESPDCRINYRLDDAVNLQSLPMADGNRRSLYGQDGIVADSKRLERFLFWPMGIPSPGAMRQWGHHATAFVGRRHFDDPRLFEDSFQSDPANRTLLPVLSHFLRIGRHSPTKLKTDISLHPYFLGVRPEMVSAVIRIFCQQRVMLP